MPTCGCSNCLTGSGSGWCGITIDANAPKRPDQLARLCVWVCAACAHEINILHAFTIKYQLIELYNRILFHTVDAYIVLLEFLQFPTTTTDGKIVPRIFSARKRAMKILYVHRAQYFHTSIHVWRLSVCWRSRCDSRSYPGRAKTALARALFNVNAPPSVDDDDDVRRCKSRNCTVIYRRPTDDVVRECAAGASPSRRRGRWRTGYDPFWT